MGGGRRERFSTQLRSGMYLTLFNEQGHEIFGFQPRALDTVYSGCKVYLQNITSRDAEPGSFGSGSWLLKSLRLQLRLSDLDLTSIYCTAL